MNLRTFIKHNFGSFPRLAAWGFNAGVFIAITGLFSGIFTISVGVITMASASFVNVLFMSKLDIQQRIKQRWNVFFSILIFLSVLSAFIGSSDTGFAMVRLRLYLPFAGLPLIVLFGPKSPHWHYKNYILYLMACAAIMGLLVNSIILTDPEQWRLTIEQGRALPTPLSHIRFGMFMSFGFLSGLLLYFRGHLSKMEKRVIILLLIVIVVNIMIASIRTAWVLTICGFTFILINESFRKNNFTYIILGSLILISLGYLGYQYIPVVHTKVSYALYDLNEYLNNTGATYSDSERIYSIKNGWSLWTQNKWFGVGSGDLYTALEANAQKIGIPVAKIPHNQFIFTMVCGGLLSLILLLSGYFLLPRKIHMSLRFPVFLFWLLYLITMLIEPTFETSAGVMGFILGASLLLKYNFEIQSKDKDIQNPKS